MTLRSLASSLGFAAVLSLGSTVWAQGTEKSAPPQTEPTPKAKAADEAKKADGSDTPKSETTTKTEDPKADANKVEPKLEKAYFAGGCFWCMEAVFERVKGVKQVVSGYSGGTVARPSYEMVCTDLTGHAESIGIEYDANIVTYDDLLDIFWIAHDPTTLNRQGPDEGTHYRSVIFYANDDQKKLAEKSLRTVTAAGLYRDPIVTQIVPLDKFWVAEKYHQDYYRLNANKDSYCRSIIAPKVAHLKEKLAYYKSHVQKDKVTPAKETSAKK
jgi:peptide-methionine (S)-S-oxide reductase